MIVVIIIIIIIIIITITLITLITLITTTSILRASLWHIMFMFCNVHVLQPRG